ncbi:FAD-dependent oxidoreductase, partial [Methanoregula sp.]|uniref:FAD-dependent oxidoreductase n=1 Tax=Methanoregula sp. TaxID=2052170 RepID=UPI000CC86DF7
MIPLHSAKYDVVVVGAGPAGSAAAGACAAAGLSTLCIEEHGTIGHPVQCAGLLSNAAFAECRVSERPVRNKVTGARVISGKGSRIQIDAQKTMAYVVDRGMLDREMAEHAADAGAGYLLHAGVCGLGINTVTTRGPGGSVDIGYKVLIAADCPRSTISRVLVLGRSPVSRAGIQVELFHELGPRFVEAALADA